MCRFLKNGFPKRHAKWVVLASFKDDATCFGPDSRIGPSCEHVLSGVEISSFNSSLEKSSYGSDNRLGRVYNFSTATFKRSRSILHSSFGCPTRQGSITFAFVIGGSMMHFPVGSISRRRHAGRSLGGIILPFDISNARSMSWYIGGALGGTSGIAK